MSENGGKSISSSVRARLLKMKSKQVPPELPLIVPIIRNFLMPVVASITHAIPIPREWAPGTGWQAAGIESD